MMLGVALMLLDVTMQACTWLTAGSFKLTAGYNEIDLNQNHSGSLNGRYLVFARLLFCVCVFV